MTTRLAMGLAVSVLTAQACGCGQRMGTTRDAGTTVLPPGTPWWCLFVPCTDGGISSRCSSATCSGCCDVNGQCNSGESPSACGSAGESCVACFGSDTCFGGSCRPHAVSCDVFSCPGCCSDRGECIIQTDDRRCGGNGSRCIDCGPAARCATTFCTPKCTRLNCLGCCAPTGECVSGNENLRCGADGVQCFACPSEATCSFGTCIVPQPMGCASCGEGECCLNGACVPATNQRCRPAGGGLDCRLCGPNDLCGGGTERGFCVRPGSTDFADSCTWDGQCRPGPSGRPTCVKVPGLADGLCSERCGADAGPCVQGTCLETPNGAVCVPACNVPGAACVGGVATCTSTDAGLVCVPRCTDSTVCAGGRCTPAGTCCGVRDQPCCTTGVACSGPSVDGGTSVCGASNTCT